MRRFEEQFCWWGDRGFIPLGIDTRSELRWRRNAILFMVRGEPLHCSDEQVTMWLVIILGRRATDSRQRILETAMGIAGRSGGEAVTVEAVAKGAKLSKAGVLYYFPSKDDLLHALVAEIVRHYEEATAKELERIDQGPGRYLRALIKARVRPEVDKAFYGLLTACANRPELLEPINRMYSRCRERQIEDGVDPILAAIISYAIEGMLFRKALGTVDLSSSENDEVGNVLTAWTSGKE